jgi:UDP-N-acetylglucosamine acyltransferase
LKRRGTAVEVIAHVKRAYKTLYRRGLSLQEALAELKAYPEDVPQVAQLVRFVESSERGIVR